LNIKKSFFSISGHYIIPLLRYYIHHSFWKYVSLPQPLYPKKYGTSELLIEANLPGIDHPTPTYPLTQFCGPLLPRPFASLSDKVTSFLDTHTTVVYVSIGTNAEWSEQSARAFIEGVETMESDSIYFLLSTKAYQIEKYFKGISFPSNILWVPYVSQLAVLQHRNVKAFVTHSGFSSIQESIWYGKPMLNMVILFKVC
jgi:UDP:flavonoid glycosyltransferase YjiC (YdhE family)